jgi:iron complex outermembrane recepter protein
MALTARACWLASATAFVVLSAGVGHPVLAQSAEAEPAAQTDIVVTAQRRAERLQDVPIAISALTGDALAPGRAATAEDLTGNVVGLQLDRVFQSSNPTIFLRGVGVNDYNPASSGAVGVVLDDVFLNSSVGQLFSVYDVDRLEVLRGPQGTLFGRNTTGGILNFVTKRPSFREDAVVSATYGRYNQFYVDGALGGPLIGNTVAARASISYKRRDGWMRNLVDGRRQNDVDSLGARVQLLFEPTDTLSINLKVEAGRSRATAYRGKQGGVFNPAANRSCTGEEVLQLTTCVNPLTGFGETADLNEARTSVTDNFENLDTHGSRLSLDWELGGATLTSITAYQWNRRQLNQDQDMSAGEIISSPFWRERARQFSQEVRLASAGDASFRWIVGAFYLRENLESATSFQFLGAFNPTPGQPFFDPVNSILTLGRRYTQITDSKALFAQADWEATPELTVTAGFRYTWDNKDLEFITVAGPAGVPGGALIPTIGLLDANPASFTIDGPIVTDDSFNRPTWRLALAYKANPDVLLYASYNRGFRSGGRNSGALVAPIEFSRIDAERNDAFEIGVKSELLDRRLRINTAAFYYDYKNLQVFTLEPGNPVPFQRLQNADARIYGAEAELTARPIDGLTLESGVAYLDTKYTRLVDVLRGDLTGNRLDKAPSWQLNGRIAYDWALSSHWQARAALTGRYQSRIFFGPTNTAPLTRDPVGTVDFEIGAGRDGGVDVALWVQNLTDRRYLQDVIDVSSLGAYGLFYNEPRTFGITVSYGR